MGYHDKRHALTCSGCGQQFLGSMHQKKKSENGLAVYCVIGCQRNNQGTPWKWLGVPHIIQSECTEQPEEIYVGY